MLDRYKRKINYLRISVTDRCNLRCIYCMPECGVELLKHEDILSFDEMYDLARTAVDMGIDKIRLTGGEPLVRKGITDLVEMLASIKEVTDFGMTTNGILLDKYAEPLKKAGLHRVNISLDTTDPEEYKRITRGGDIQKVYDGIKAARAAGLLPIKINCVVKKSHDEANAQQVKAFCEKEGLQIRYIHQMDLEHGDFTIVEGGEGGDCAHCNRLRLTSDGNIMPCLFSDIGYNIREYGNEKAIRLALENKPQCGGMNHHGKFYHIGG